MEIPLKLQEAIDQDLKELDEIERQSAARRQASWSLWGGKKVDVVSARPIGGDGNLVVGQ